MYPYFRTWTALRRRLDPPSIFGNCYLDRIFSTGESALNTSTTSAAVGLFARKNFEAAMGSSPLPLPQPQEEAANASAVLSPKEQDLLSTSWSSIASTETTDLMMKMDEEDECDSIATLLTADTNDQSALEEGPPDDQKQQKKGNAGDEQQQADSSSSTP